MIPKRLFCSRVGDRLNTHGISRLTIFEASRMTKYMFVTSRYQIMAYCFGSVFYCQYNLFIKWNKISQRQVDLRQACSDSTMLQEKKEKLERRLDRLATRKYKLTMFNASLLGISVLATLATWRMGRVIIRSIDYLPKNRMLEVNYYSTLCFKRPVGVAVDGMQRFAWRGSNNFDWKSCVQYTY